MSVTGLCQICQSAEATHQCNRCGALVCTRHFEPELGYCAECAIEVKPDDDREGGDTYQF